MAGNVRRARSTLSLLSGVPQFALRSRIFPFCISCALPVDNPPARLIQSSARRRRAHGNHRDQRCNSCCLRVRLRFPNSEKPAPAFILMCTKNTELTRARFARTVGFASPKKTARSGAVTQRSSKLRQHQERRVRSARMKSEQWKTYRTRFLVKAKKLNSGLSFIDHLGRHHCGRKGDYLVESCDGVLSIAPRQIFEDIYVPMPCIKTQTSEAELPTDDLVPLSGEIMNLGTFRMEPLNIERVPTTKLHNCPVP